MQQQGDFIVSFLEEMKPALLNIARHCRADFDDIMQQAALIALEALPKLNPDSPNPQAYLNVVVGRQIRHYLGKMASRVEMSLDQPIDEESYLALVDTLPAPPPAPETLSKQEKRRLQALSRALHRLPKEEQEYLCRTRNIVGFRPIAPPRSKPNNQRTRESLATNAYLHLRRDKVLARTIQG